MRRKKGFTLVELLVVISIISLLTGILLPVLGEAKRQAKSLLGMNNQKQIVAGVTQFALDHRDSYPKSVATIKRGITWNWQEPTMMTAVKSCFPGQYRSMSYSLRSYIENASVMFCPNAPRKYEYLQRAWDAGDNWDNPDTDFPDDSVYGTYCFYWNYTGFLGDQVAPFKGPRDFSGGRGQSKLLVSDYFGFGHW